MTRYLFFLLFILHFTFYIFHSSNATAIEVGGHISEDTVWSPENNPYHVTEHVFVDNGVTLRILPGTEIKLKSSRLFDSDDISHCYGNFSSENLIKGIKVYGRIIAEGTAEDSITFNRDIDSLYYRWGIIHLEDGNDISIFKHCSFKYSGVLYRSVGAPLYGSITFENEGGIVDRCSFKNTIAAIDCCPTNNLLITNNSYVSHETDYEFALQACFIDTRALSLTQLLTVCNNKIDAYDSHLSIYIAADIPAYFAFNEIKGEKIHLRTNNYYFYKEKYIDSGHSFGVNDEEFDRIFLRDCYFYSCSETRLWADSIWIVGNTFEDSYFISLEGKMYNNTAKHSILRISSNLFYNNILSDSCYIETLAYQQYHITNNTYLNSYDIIKYIDNNMSNIIVFLVECDPIYDMLIYGERFISNSIINFELPIITEDGILMDGGGNIYIEDPSEVFVDWENGDFRLCEGSPAIDAGLVTNYPFAYDGSNNYRIWDGDNDGEARIDIGALEYGAPPYTGKVCGYTYDIDNMEPVQYVFLQFSDAPENFVFSDSLGYFELDLAPGLYSINTNRVFYEAETLSAILVEEGQTTNVEITLDCTLEPVNANEEFIIQNSELLISNYPNPFNPVTTINFSLPLDSKVRVSIFNIKGQKVATLKDEYFTAGDHSVVWNGKDDSGNSVSSGVFFCRVEAGSESATKKLLLLK